MKGPQPQTTTLSQPETQAEPQSKSGRASYYPGNGALQDRMGIEPVSGGIDLNASLPGAVVQGYELRISEVVTYTKHLGLTMARSLETMPFQELQFLAALRDLEPVAGQVEQGVVKLMEQSGVTRPDSQQDPILPPQSEVKAWNEALRELRQLSLAPEIKILPSLAGSIERTTRVGASAVVACFQALALMQGRTSWRTNEEEPTVNSDMRTINQSSITPEIKRVYGAAGQAPGVKEKGTSEAETTDWCGFFVCSNLVRGAGLDESLKTSFNHTSDGVRFFSYNQNKKLRSGHNPNYIWSDETQRWMLVREYHQLRGSERKLWCDSSDPNYQNLFSDVKEALSLNSLEGGLRPGDIVIRDTDNDGDGNHYGMVDSTNQEEGFFSTVEGNFMNGKADPETGKVRRKANGDLDKEGYGRWTDGNNKSRLRDGFAAVEHDTQAQKKQAGRKHQGVTSASGGNIRIVGRPSACDFEEHYYAQDKPPDLTKAPTPKK